MHIHNAQKKEEPKKAYKYFLSIIYNKLIKNINDKYKT